MTDNTDMTEKPESDEPLDDEELINAASDDDLEAPEADRYEQQLTVNGAAGATGRPRRPEPNRDDEVPEADAAEQAQPVGLDDEWDR